MKIKPGALALLLVLFAAVIFVLVRSLGAGDGSTKGVPRMSGSATTPSR